MRWRQEAKLCLQYRHFLFLSNLPYFAMIVTKMMSLLRRQEDNEAFKNALNFSGNGLPDFFHEPFKFVLLLLTIQRKSTQLTLVTGDSKI